MLCISLSEGEYFTINKEIIVKFQRFDGSRIRIGIDAPREMPIIRGTLLARDGAEKSPETDG